MAITLDELISRVQQASPEALQQLEAASETAAMLGELGDALLNHFVDRCRRSGHTWAEIGEHLGVTRQAAQKKFVTIVDEITFERFTGRARRVLEKADEAGRRLGHSYLGTEHLLLGLFDVEDGLAAHVFDRLRVSRDRVEELIVQMIGRGSLSAPLGRPGFTPKALRALQEAVNQSRDFSHNYIGTEHILLGLFRGHDSVAKTVLEQVGVTKEKVQPLVLELLVSFRAAKPGPAKPAPAKKVVKKVLVKKPPAKKRRSNP